MERIDSSAAQCGPPQPGAPPPSAPFGLGVGMVRAAGPPQAKISMRRGGTQRRGASERDVQSARAAPPPEPRRKARRRPPKPPDPAIRGLARQAYQWPWLAVGGGAPDKVGPRSSWADVGSGDAPGDGATSLGQVGPRRPGWPHRAARQVGAPPPPRCSRRPFSLPPPSRVWPRPLPLLLGPAPARGAGGGPGAEQPAQDATAEIAPLQRAANPATPVSLPPPLAATAAPEGQPKLLGGRPRSPGRAWPPLTLPLPPSRPPSRPPLSAAWQRRHLQRCSRRESPSLSTVIAAMAVVAAVAAACSLIRRWRIRSRFSSRSRHRKSSSALRRCRIASCFCRYTHLPTRSLTRPLTRSPAGPPARTQTQTHSSSAISSALRAVMRALISPQPTPILSPPQANTRHSPTSTCTDGFVCA